MKSKPAHSRIIDGSVLLTMAVCALIAILVIAFRFKDYTPCTPPAISVQPGPKYVGEIVYFKAITSQKPRSLTWDFGDNSLTQADGLVVNHIFKKPGRYEIALNSDKQCDAYTTIYVLQTRRIPDESSQPDFTGPQTVEVGQPATFVDATPHATKWEWRFGETNIVDATKPRVTYTYRTPGTKRVLLLVNGKMRGEWLVLVVPRPFNEKPPRGGGRGSRSRIPDQPVIAPVFKPTEEGEKPKPKIPDVSKEELENILKQIVDGEKTAAELAGYICNANALQVNFNGELMSLDKLYEELRKIKNDRKIRKLEITTEKDADLNCIKTMTIKLDRKGLFR